MDANLIAMDISEFRTKGKEVIDFIADYFENVNTLRVHPDVSPGFLAKTLPQTAPSHGELYDDIVKDFEKKIMPGVSYKILSFSQKNPIKISMTIPFLFY